MTEAHILRIESLPVLDRGNGIQTIPLVTEEIGSEHMTTGLAHFPVGAKVPRHSHNSDEQVTILEGEAEAELDGRRPRLDADDTTLIPASKPHHFCERQHDAARDIVDLCLLGGTRTFAETGEPSLTCTNAFERPVPSESFERSVALDDWNGLSIP